MVYLYNGGERAFMFACYVCFPIVSLPDKKMALKKALPVVYLALQITYRTRIWPSNIITERELGSQMALPDENWALKYHYQTFSIFYSKLSDFSPMTH